MSEAEQALVYLVFLFASFVIGFVVGNIWPR